VPAAQRLKQYFGEEAKQFWEEKGKQF